ncbi:P63C domain-containing protein [Enterovirga rhinocerotis]|uniref:P63C domain-containing protein n=1 Tax=Enterovirga rhinocerotis TaxID=1339210 RepID=A0A4R7BXL7_9HYPH|nr:P63C domain-containing protein [Enterovirga rhinocerotis]TDR90331.1 P63C domain-containing protein [Enterovirga rhinocerotis]
MANSKSAEPQSKGGKARAAALSSEERRAVAKVGATARWEAYRALPKATHGSAEHPLRLGDIDIPCYVLDDGRRVLSLGGIVKALGMSIGGAGSGEGDRLGKFATGKAISPFVSSSLISRIAEPVRFRTPSGGSAATGYEANILPEICEAVLAARQAGALLKQQMHIADQCEALIRAFAKVGIVALVDEVTGFQADRERDELYKLLSVYLAEERLAWAKRFPDEFYKQIYRLKGWRWPVGRAKTPLLGHITNDIVYERLPPGVLEALRELNPTAEDTKRRKYKHHQFLSETVGQPDLRDHILQLIPIMKISRDWSSFKRHLEVAFPRIGSQGDLDLDSGDVAQ